MKKILFCFLFISFHYFTYTQNLKPTEEIVKYYDFLKKDHADPVDYVMDLFEKYDVVILGERDHRDTTQYDLIEHIISDPRFIEKVGNIYTEVGLYNMNDTINTVLKHSKSFEEFEKGILSLYLDLDYNTIWEKYVFIKLMTSVYNVNAGLPDEKKLNMVFNDISFSWYDCPDEQTYREFDKFAYNFREEIMANNAITELYKLFRSNSPRKKALIIYNCPHSCKYYDQEEHRSMAAQYIFDRFPGRVANVMLNWKKLIDEKNNFLIQEGKWDAAFYLSGNKPVAFDFVGSPFGDDLLDYYAKPLTETRYKDIYTGFIFYKPIYEWVGAIAYRKPILTERFKKEAIRRESIFGAIYYRSDTTLYRMPNKSEEDKQLIWEKTTRYYNTFRIFPIFKEQQQQNIMKWMNKYIDTTDTIQSNYIL